MRVLVLDDQPAEARRMADEVRRAGSVAECQIAHDRPGFQALLEQAGSLDVVLSAHRMTDGFTAFDALPHVRARFPDAAFIVVAGPVTEELASDCVRAGVDDFVSREYLARLRFAIPAAVEKRRSGAHQRRAEAELLLKTRALEAAANAIVITDAEGRIEWVNPAFTELTGYSAAEAVGETPRLLRSGRHDAAFYEGLWKTVLSGGVWRGTMVNRRKNGTTYHEEMTITPLRGTSGAITHFVAVKQDVTERREMEHSRDRLARIVEATSDFVGVSDAEHRVVYVNPAGRRMVGLDDDEGVEGWPIERFHPPWVVELLQREALPAALAHGSWRGETALLHRDGREVPVSQQVVFQDIGGAEPLSFTVIRDLSDVAERDRLGEQLRQAQKLEAVGRLAGGIAHDFNNMLGVIIGYGELLQRRLAAGSHEASRLEQMLAAAHRAAGLTRQLLAFSRKQVLQARVVDPNALIADLQPMLARLIGEDVELRLDLRARGRVRVDPGQFQQVLMNLVINARDAMPGGGRISIASGDVNDSAGEPVTARPPGPCVSLVVSDTGQGMDQATQQRIFEPFFTTKPEGKGTGLGLPTVYGIVQQSGGTIRVESAPGAGATFEILLPRVDAGGHAEPVSARPARILLVVGSPAARDWMAEVLRDEGHAVVDVAVAAAAAGRPEAAFDLALIDLDLGVGTGRTLAERLPARWAGLRVGLLGGPPVGLPTELAGLEILRLPFGPADLRAFVRARLGS